jgi:hypothetical protein
MMIGKEIGNGKERQHDYSCAYELRLEPDFHHLSLPQKLLSPLNGNPLSFADIFHKAGVAQHLQVPLDRSRPITELISQIFCAYRLPTLFQIQINGFDPRNHTLIFVHFQFLLYYSSMRKELM